ncbi:hypothetical protein PN498_06500 [Oscillatoria sp. CS-180]|uniref:hypothetical protein n=1 Tax=Oscillatoria sp. CS-180 TaxID=3021720 RepID=UPI00232E842B|nr:hypothetical protein [Oscillatoria sp. CS-180]MDB9525631.1 hypothetical protein [Oscillatoria sp. CS-180]
MTLKTSLDPVSDLAATDYLVVGIATCFRRDEGELEKIKVVEPVPSAYLESLLQGIPTSYEAVLATTAGSLLDEKELSQLTGRYDAVLCDSFSDRVTATARTYRARPSATQLIPPGTSRTDLNYSTEKKRVLNFKNVVKTEDNVRQHKYTHKKL